jgi:cysteine-rich repeat protein
MSLASFTVGRTPATLDFMRTCRSKWLDAAVLALVLSSPASAMAVCGDGVSEAPEVCDDGNLVDGDGCDSNCTPTACGNGIVTMGEECDDGNLAPGDCCSPLCVIDNLPPDCSEAVASVDEMWPPNHKMQSVGILGVTDPDGDPLVLTVTAIGQDEPIDATGDGATCPDGVGVGLDSVSLRSERSGRGDGRFYHVTFVATDVCNATCSGEVSVVVRHDRSPKKEPGDGGPLYDSTLGMPPCEGDSCDPADCVPDPDDLDACGGETPPESVTGRLEKAKQMLAHGGKGVGRAAARQLGKAAKRAAKAARKGDLSSECAAALVAAVDDAGECVVCRVE